MTESSTRSDRRTGMALVGLGLLILAAGPVSWAPAAEGDSDASDTPTGVNLAEGLTINLWAKEPMLASPVAIAFDDQGRAYVTRTVRRRNSALPIRAHPDWMVEDLSFNTVADRRAHHKRVLDPSHSATNTWMTDYNDDGVRDWHDLQVQSDKIYQITDTDGDGKADRSTIFAEGFDSLTAGVAGGVLPYDGAVYATVVPDLWKLWDTDDDGKADRRESLSHGYGVHMGYSGHNMHGLTLGPDGRIYWSIGDIGMNVKGPDGKQWSFPHGGAVMRAEPDGSDFELFATGLRNPQELAFDEHGNLFTVDNDSDRPGDRERIVYITEGSDSGWRIYWQYKATGYNPWMNEGLYNTRFDGQPAYITPAVAHFTEGPAGIAYNPGTALGPKWRKHFFVAEFNGSSATALVSAFTLKPDGATFKLNDSEDMITGVLTTGLAFSPGGELYLADWVGGWTVHDKGRVWKVDVAETKDQAYAKLRAQTKKLLGEGMKDRGVEELATLLGHADMRVRMAAQFELVSRDESGRAALMKTAKEGENLQARLHGIWGIGQLGREDANAVKPLLPLLHDQEAEVRAQTAKVIGEAKDESAAKELASLLKDSSKRVRFFSAIALGELGAEQAVPALVDMLAHSGGDPYLRHAGVMGLSRTADQQTLTGLADHDSRAVRLAAVVALRRQGSPWVREFLHDEDEEVVAEAARAIHDDRSIPQAVPALAQVIERKGWTNEALLRRSIDANLELGGQRRARALAAYAARSSAPAKMRVQALESLAVWNDPPVLDRVLGSYRPGKAHDPAVARDALGRVIEPLLSDAPTDVRIAAADAAGALRYESADSSLNGLVMDQRQPAALRAAALRALGTWNSPRIGEAVRAALGSDNESLRKAARQLLVKLDPSSDMTLEVLTKALRSGSTGEKQAALRMLGKADSEQARALLKKWMDKLRAGDVPRPLRFDLLAAAREVDTEPLNRAIQQYEASKPDDDPLAAYSETLYGGDAEAGREIVFHDLTAQCLRCHHIRGRGGHVAPNLTRVERHADRRYILESMLRPNAKIAEGYGMVVLKLKDGRTIAGTLGNETKTHVTIQTPAGQKEKVARAQIASRTESSASAMPPMGAALSKRQIRDVIEYLMSPK